MGNSLQDLTIKNNFMFAAVMMEDENCKELLEMILKIKIAKITVYTEKTIVYNPEYKGVRLDIEAEDEAHTHYDVEIQVNRKETLLRSRYYHSQMDVELLTSGTPYEKLPDTYVIFICDYDPFYKKKYQYTITQKCEEVPELDVSAGVHTIFLSTKGKNDTEVSEELRKFLKFVGSKLEDSEADFQDSYVEKLQKTVRKIKQDRKMGERYMVFQEMLREEREEGIKEGIKRGIKQGIVDTIKSILVSKDIFLEDAIYLNMVETYDKSELQEMLIKVSGMQIKVELLEWIEKNIVTHK